MINIEIKSDAVMSRSGISKKSGQQYLMREQEGWVFLVANDGKPQPYPTRILMALEDNQPPFLPGNYILDSSSFFVGQYGKFTLGRIRLTPAPGKTTVKAA